MLMYSVTIVHFVQSSIISTRPQRNAGRLITTHYATRIIPDPRSMTHCGQSKRMLDLKTISRVLLLNQLNDQSLSWIQGARQSPLKSPGSK